MRASMATRGAASRFGSARLALQRAPRFSHPTPQRLGLGPQCCLRPASRDPVVLSQFGAGGCRAAASSNVPVQVRPPSEPAIIDQPYFESKHLEWSELPQRYRQAWEALGWTEHSWDSEDPLRHPPTATADWRDLDNVQKTAARILGYDEGSWDADEGEVWQWHKDVFWHAMKPEHQQAWRALGWDPELWDAQSHGHAPKTESLYWVNLTRDEQNAAARLGYTMHSWDSDSGSSWFWKAGVGKYTDNPLFILAAGVLTIPVMWIFTMGRSHKDGLDRQEDQVKARHMRRVSMEQRRDWAKRCEEIGFDFHSENGIRWSPEWQGKWGHQDPYWCESAAYLFSRQAKAELEDATWELHNMCLQVVDRVVHDDELMDRFEIPENLRQAVRISWARRQPDLLGRFDLLFDGREPPKLLEYNADTPTLLLESSLAQAQWKKDMEERGQLAERSYAQFNSLHQDLLSSWRTFLDRSKEAVGTASSNPEVVFAAQRASIEERCNIDYLAKTARQAGILGHTAELSDLHPDPLGHVWEDPGAGAAASGNAFPDDARLKVEALWKLYPYEWLANEELGHALEWGSEPSGTIWAEPPWKMILANKSLLVLLWDMFPGHPNLLPAFFTVEEARAYEESSGKQPREEWGWVSKPKFGREGIGVRYSFESPSLEQFDRSVRLELETMENTGVPYNPGLLKMLEKQGASVLGRDAGTSHLLEERQHEADVRGQVSMRAELPFPPMGGPVFQLYQDVDTFSGRRPVLGSWVVFGNPSAICVREDIQNTTNNDSCFTPHLVDEHADSELLVTQPTNQAVNVQGSYFLSGRLRNADIYYSPSTSLYLMKSSDGEWMFTEHESGGYDGVTGVAVARSGVSNPTFIPSTSWEGVGGTRFGDITITRGLPQNAKVQLKLSPEQAEIRTQLYGKHGGTVTSDASRRHHGEWLHRTHSQHLGGQWGSYGGVRNGPGTQGQQQTHKQAEQKERHGRRHKRPEWKQYGKRPATGTYGRSMGNLGSSGGYGYGSGGS